MKSKVYFISVDNSDDLRLLVEKLGLLLSQTRILDFIGRDDRVAIKMHFGEEANTGFVKPECLRLICDTIGGKGATAFLADTNTLYRGKRTNSKDHLEIAHRHGFTKTAVGAEVVIPDETKEENTINRKIDQKFIRIAKLVRVFVDADALVAVSHFKGHMMTSFGGALKNIGMGCATREGKLMQHSDISPIVYETKCVGCGECAKVCPAGAIRIKNNKSVISNLKCIGCASCIAACPYMAIDVPWESGGSRIQEKMVEYAYAVLKGKKKAGFINFAVKITKECDCMAKDDPRISPDIGILASMDPVSIDKASLDLVTRACGKDIFKELHPKRDGAKQLKHAEELGLGSIDYELLEL